MKAQIIVIVFLLTTISEFTYACSCARQPKDLEVAVERAIENSDSVVLAKAVTVEPLEYYEGFPKERENVLSERTHFTEIRSWKGDHGKQFYTEIVTACCMCGISFVEDEEYLLYLNKNNENDTYRASSCGRTNNIKYAQDDIKYLDIKMPNKLLQPTAKAAAE